MPNRAPGSRPGAVPSHLPSPGRDRPGRNTNARRRRRNIGSRSRNVNPGVRRAPGAQDLFGPRASIGRLKCSHHPPQARNLQREIGHTRIGSGGAHPSRSPALRQRQVRRQGMVEKSCVAIAPGMRRLLSSPGLLGFVPAKPLRKRRTWSTRPTPPPPQGAQEHHRSSPSNFLSRE